MQRFKWPRLATLVLVLVSAAALSTLIDPYLDFGAPVLALAVNAVVPLILVLLLWGILGRAWLALLVLAAVLAVLQFADHTKVVFLDTDLVYADFTVIGGLLKDPQLILGFIHPQPLVIAGAVLALAAVVAIGWFSRRQPPAPWPFRVACVGVGLLAGVVAWNHRAPDVIHPLHWEVFQQVHGARHVGIAGNILLGRMTARDVQRVPDPKAEQAFWNEPLVRKAEQHVSTQGSGKRPDIVIVQSESLFEPSLLCGFSDKPVLQRFAQEQPSLPSNLHVPVFGGRTLQTEFETLTGAPISFFPGSMFAYYELLGHPVDALPRVLHHEGYRTVAMHPNNRGFWRRDAAMPEMGFQTFQDIGSFIYPKDFSERGHVTDAALTRAILAELDASTGPTFITAVSMDNHGPWGRFAPDDDSSLGLPAKLKGEARAELADYVEHAVDADKAYGFLLDALKRRGRPAIVLIYGDHLPSLPPVYQQLCFKDGLPPQKHFPPYRVWANFPVPSPPAVSSAYLSQGWLAYAAGLPLHGQLLANTLAGLVAHDPSVSEADRKRILAEYANIAAANLRHVAPEPQETVFVGRDHALDTLMKLSVKGAEGTSSLYNDLSLASGPGKSAHISFDLRGGLSSITLRPYLGAMTARCLANPAVSRSTFTVEGDGRLLYRADVTPKTLRLATLDLQGVKQLTLSARASKQTDSCGVVRLRVAQMLCYSARCDRPGSAASAAVKAAGASRILSSDPIDGDIAALDTLLPERRKQAQAKVDNLTWMLARETAKQQGFAPFRVDVDGQLFMHPAEDHDAWIDFDVSGIDTLDLTPHINHLDATCKAMNTPGKEAGVVGLTVSLDGKPVVPRFLLDRNYAGSLPLSVKGAKTLRVEVDKGNAVAWCDWFSVGVDKLAGPALAGPADQPPSASSVAAAPTR